jgi:hypothetical protein
MALTMSQIADLLASKNNKASKHGRYATGEFGKSNVTLHYGAANGNQVGKHVGRAGTVVRSSKGRTYRKDDGSRRYENHESDVLWYIIKTD